MDGTWIDQDYPARRCGVIRSLMQKRLAPTLDQADHKIIMAMARIGMPNIIGVQKSKVQLRTVSYFCPFFGSHVYFVP
jgi:hypothetical protein